MLSTVLGTRNTALMAFTFLAGKTGRKHLNIQSPAPVRGAVANRNGRQDLFQEGHSQGIVGLNEIIHVKVFSPEPGME